MRTTLVLTALLATALPAAADATVLFEDAAGDVGPWPTLVVGVGAPGPADVDLVRATLDGATLTLEVASLPASVPADRIWSAGWTLDDERYFAVGYMSTGGKTSSGACVWEGMGDQGPEGEPECVAVDAVAVAGTPGRFEFVVPEAYLAGGKSGPGGVVIVTPEGSAAPLAALHYTGLTVVDFAWGDDVATPEVAAPVEAASVGASEPRAVPGATLPLAALALAGVALLARRA